MDKIKLVKMTDPITEEIIEYAIIDRGNGEYTSILKSDYDAQQEHLTENPTEDVE